MPTVNINFGTERGTRGKNWRDLASHADLQAAEWVHISGVSWC